MKKVRKLITIAALALAVGCVSNGCSSTTIRRGDISATNRRFFWSTEGAEITFASQQSGSNSVVQASAKITKSNASAEAMQAVANGVASGITAGLTGKK